MKSVREHNRLHLITRNNLKVLVNHTLNHDPIAGLLKKFLCVVPHNRKFFLPETFVVFKNTVTQMKDFSVVKMLNGFESISQYANNLFTKPWRKEYRSIKMYSGFFIHEIKSNLIEPEELFVAMGYKKMPNHELVLDGEICPDQVMNMSRDAMTAYTECKIMNRIYSELTTTYKISCSWVDVFNYREQHTGGVTETIEAIKNLIQHHNMTASTAFVPRDKQLQGKLCSAFVFLEKWLNLHLFSLIQDRVIPNNLFIYLLRQTEVQWGT